MELGRSLFVQECGINNAVSKFFLSGNEFVCCLSYLVLTQPMKEMLTLVDSKKKGTVHCKKDCIIKIINKLIIVQCKKITLNCKNDPKLLKNTPNCKCKL